MLFKPSSSRMPHLSSHLGGPAPLEALDARPPPHSWSLCSETDNRDYGMPLIH